VSLIEFTIEFKKGFRKNAICYNFNKRGLRVMDLKRLYSMQKELDTHIVNNHQLQNENLVDRKILALLVEVSELANETRCFKFWSVKPSAAKEKIVEEFVDGIHFILSLGLEFQFDNQEIHFEENGSGDLTEQFLTVFDLISTLKKSRAFVDYKTLFQAYIKLGVLLGFSGDDIEQAYFLKNEVNYDRQEKGY
jgi:dimeric dUTPase (all-alpha-NTP-PPase superfamily)